MTTQTILLLSIAPGLTRSVTLARGQYTWRILVDGVEVLSRIKGRPWVIALDLDDMTMIADACRGALRLTHEAAGKQPA